MNEFVFKLCFTGDATWRRDGSARSLNPCTFEGSHQVEVFGSDHGGPVASISQERRLAAEEASRSPPSWSSQRT